MGASLSPIIVEINIDQINIDSINDLGEDDAMTTFIRSAEAARMLGVSPATLYAYVSRGRIGRRTAPDGRASLFALDEVEALAARGRRRSGPRPTIDVQIASAVTTLSEDGVDIRGHDLPELAARRSFEDVCELLWTSELPPEPVRWPTADREDLDACAAIAAHPDVTPTGRLTAAAIVLGGRRPDDAPSDAARRLITLAPPLLGSRRATGPLARRLVSAWRPRPSDELVAAVDTALALLADHELATSTLAVRVAASVRTTAYGALAAGLTTVEGALHGSAARESHRLLADCAERGSREVLREHRAERRRVAGFGHKVYRGVDPRFGPLLDAVRRLDGDRSDLAVLDELLAAAGETLAHQPNIDLALGALTWVSGLDPDVPIFAVARLAGWGAHCAEEFAEPPVRFRGLARRPAAVA